jgi:hypothetical protein
MFLLKFLLTFCLVNGLLSGKIDPSFGKKSEKHEIEKSPEKEVKNNSKHFGEKIDISSNDLSKEANSILNNSDIGNPILGVNYYLKDRNGYYIRWDGRNSTISGITRYGLTIDTNNNAVDRDWYLFVIETYGSDLSIKNVKTEQYITNDYFTLTYYLMNETSSTYQRGVRLISTYDSLKIIQTTYSGAPDYLTYYNSSYNGVSYLAGVTSISNSYVAYIDFISDIKLNAKIAAFNYEQLNDTTIQSHLTKVNLISPTYVINNSSSKITNEIENKIALSESLNWKFDQNLDIFESVSINKGLPSLLRSNGGFGKIESNFEYKSKSVKINHDLDNEREYSVKKTMEIEPNSVLRIESFVENIEDLEIPFTAVAEITGNDGLGALTGDQILSIINDYLNTNLTIINISENSVSLEVSGALFATFGLDNKFIVTNTD